MKKIITMTAIGLTATLFMTGCASKEITQTKTETTVELGSECTIIPTDYYPALTVAIIAANKPNGNHPSSGCHFFNIIACTLPNPTSSTAHKSIRNKDITRKL